MLSAFNHAASLEQQQDSIRAITKGIDTNPKVAMDVLHASLQGLLDMALTDKDGKLGVDHLIGKAIKATKKELDIPLVKNSMEGIFRTLFRAAVDDTQDADAKQRAVTMFDTFKKSSPKLAERAISMYTDPSWNSKMSVNVAIQNYTP